LNGRRIRELVVGGDAAHRGSVHGAAFHNEIRRYTEERVRLSANGTWSGRAVTVDEAVALATRMLPAHRSFDPDLYEEMEAMANAGGISPAEAVIVGGFTDFVDVLRAGGATGLAEEDDCTAVIVPDELAGGSGFLAQTWDMHDSATEHVTLIRVAPPSGPGGLVFTTVGCLGQIGMNQAGIAVGINNLTATNGQVGVTWPFVVRKVLAQTSIDDALVVVLEAELAGAHNYLLFDESGTGYNIEAMPGYRAVTRMEREPLVHTNHCLDTEARRLEAPRPGDLMKSSVDRLATATDLLAKWVATGDALSVQHMIDLTREPEVICRRSAPPYHNESSGAAVMRPGTGEFWACWGVPADNQFEAFKV
jgi:isopenicillin-N N-acyltransferase like protein